MDRVSDRKKAVKEQEKQEVLQKISRLQALFQEQKQHLDYFFSSIDLAKAERILQEILSCEGSLVFSGVGKSGLIAEKLVKTFLSIGIKAFFLCPLNSLHGDIGIISEKDLCVFLSKSGNTRELLDILPSLRQKKARLMAWVSQKNSILENLVDTSILLPLEKELCPFNLAPTTSPMLQLLFGDILAVAMMQEKKFTKKHFAENHPAGSIGKKLFLKVKDLMKTPEEIAFCDEKETVQDILHRLSAKRLGCVLVVDQEKKLLGVFTDGDLRRTMEKEPQKFLHRTLKEVMTRNPTWVEEDLLAQDALKKMEEDSKKRMSVLPVLKNSRVLGLLHMHDIIRSGLGE